MCLQLSLKFNFLNFKAMKLPKNTYTYVTIQERHEKVANKQLLKAG